ncbi:MAG: hypothetical protein ACRDPZ_01050, partial [Gaiellaceae bacterium]
MFRLGALLAVGAAMVAVPAAAQVSANSVLDSPTGAWFVELDGSADGFRASARASGLRYTERFQFNHLWHGLSV